MKYLSVLKIFNFCIILLVLMAPSSLTLRLIYRKHNATAQIYKPIKQIVHYGNIGTSPLIDCPLGEARDKHNKCRKVNNYFSLKNDF